MRTAAQRFTSVLARVWNYVRAVMGDQAYERYLERGGGDGMDFEDWLEAKRELRELSDRK